MHKKLEKTNDKMHKLKIIKTELLKNNDDNDNSDENMCDNVKHKKV